MLFEFELNTSKQELIDITREVRESISESGVNEGICIVFCPHTTAAITINENADPDVKGDFVIGMDKIFPNLNIFCHSEGNSDAHLKSSSVGVSETIIVANGRPLLGRWQGIYFCEFDGPRRRKFYVKVIKG